MGGNYVVENFGKVKISQDPTNRIQFPFVQYQFKLCSFRCWTRELTENSLSKVWAPLRSAKWWRNFRIFMKNSKGGGTLRHFFDKNLWAGAVVTRMMLGTWNLAQSTLTTSSIRKNYCFSDRRSLTSDLTNGTSKMSILTNFYFYFVFF